MAKKRKVIVQPTAANQTRGVTSEQRNINRNTGVDRNYNYNRNSASSSASTFMNALANAPGASDTERNAIKRDMMNAKKRKSNGGSGG